MPLLNRCIKSVSAQQKYLETIIQVISWKTKVLSTYQILQRHCVGEPSQKFLLDLNLRETVLRLDFTISPDINLTPTTYQTWKLFKKDYAIEVFETQK